MTEDVSLQEDAIRKVVPDDLMQAIRQGECILFIGAGLSKEAGYPDARELARRLRSEIKPDLRPDEDASLGEVAQAFESSRGYSRADLVMGIKKALTPPQGWSPDRRTLKLIAHIPYLSKRIITTNWDGLIEDTIREELDIRPTVVIQDLDIGKVTGSVYVVYKIHGSLDKEETIVATSLDYRRLYQELFEPKSLLMAHMRALLTGNRVIYVGYSLQDEDFLELLNQIQSALTDKAYFGHQQYALLPRLDAPQAEYSKLQKNWARKHVEIIDCTAREFFEEVYQQTSEFKNRERETDLLLTTRSPYVEIVGNVGSGKTRLLEEIKVRYNQELRWPNTVYVNLERSHDPTKSIADALRDSSLDTPASIRQFAKSNGLLILLDSVDRVDPGRMANLCEEFLPEVIDPRDRRFSRVIWATRYSLSSHMPFSVKNNLLSLPLSMLSENVVAELVSDYANVMIGRRLNDDEAQDLAHDLLELAGDGHPGLIKAALLVMKRDTELGFSANYLRNPKGRSKAMNAMYRTIKVALPADPSTRGALETALCVCRGVHPNLLPTLEQHGLVEMTGLSADQYVKKLLRTRLFDASSYPIYRFDTVIRHVLRDRLDMARLQQVNQVCREHFWNASQSVTEDVQRAYLQEWLFHICTGLIAEDTDPISRFESLRRNLQGVSLRSNVDSASAKRMAKEVRDDREIMLLVKKCFGEQSAEILNTIEALPTLPL